MKLLTHSNTLVRTTNKMEEERMISYTVSFIECVLATSRPKFHETVFLC